MAGEVGVAEEVGLLAFFGDEDFAAPEVDVAGLQGGGDFGEGVERDGAGTLEGGGEALEQFDLEAAPFGVDLETHRRDTHVDADFQRLARSHFFDLWHRGVVGVVLAEPAPVDLLVQAVGANLGQKSVEGRRQFRTVLPEREADVEGLFVAEGDLGVVARQVAGRDGDLVVLEGVDLAADQGSQALDGALVADDPEVVLARQFFVVIAAGLYADDLALEIIEGFDLLVRMEIFARTECKQSADGYGKG